MKPAPPVTRDTGMRVMMVGEDAGWSDTLMS